MFVKALRANPMVPVLTVSRVADAVPLAEALLAGGLTNLEVTLRTPVALDVIAAMKAEVPGLSVGAGTVLNEGDVDACRRIGADFIVTPGTTAPLRVALLASGIDTMVGVSTASEAMTCLSEGFEVLKFFPAEQSGGAAALKSLSGPLSGALFCPTGGVTPEKAPEYLALANVVAVGGTWIAPAALIEAGDFATITANARRAVALAVPFLR